jgi:hypothetical protein
MPKVKENRVREQIKRVKIACKVKVKGRAYEHVSTTKNPDYEAGLKDIPFESCLIHNKENKFPSQKITIRTTPKWLTHLAVLEPDEEGLPVWSENYTTNDFKARNHRKNKAITKFCAKYMPLYKSKEVSCFFITLTKANSSKVDIRTMIRVMTIYMDRLGWGVRGFVWVLEVSENLHMHYHVGIATNRVNLKGKKLPKLLQLERVWGCRTEIDFVKKNIEGYMRKYFAKNSYVAEGFRSYGISRKLK